MVQAEKVDKPPSEQRGTPEERRTFLEQWADENPDGTIEAARQALRERFDDTTISTKAISEIMRGARQRMKDAHSLVRRGPGASASQEMPAITVQDPANAMLAAALELQRHDARPVFIQTIVRLLRQGGIRKIEIKPDGSVSIDLEV